MTKNSWTKYSCCIRGVTEFEHCFLSRTSWIQGILNTFWTENRFLEHKRVRNIAKLNANLHFLTNLYWARHNDDEKASMPERKYVEVPNSMWQVLLCKRRCPRGLRNQQVAGYTIGRLNGILHCGVVHECCTLKLLLVFLLGVVVQRCGDHFWVLITHVLVTCWILFVVWYPMLSW